MLLLHFIISGKEYTILAPDEQALVASQDTPSKEDIQYHVIEGVLKKKDVKDGLAKTLLAKKDVRFGNFRKDGKKVRVVCWLKFWHRMRCFLTGSPQENAWKRYTPLGFSLSCALNLTAKRCSQGKSFAAIKTNHHLWLCVSLSFLILLLFWFFLHLENRLVSDNNCRQRTNRGVG